MKESTRKALVDSFVGQVMGLVVVFRRELERELVGRIAERFPHAKPPQLVPRLALPAPAAEVPAKRRAPKRRTTSQDPKPLPILPPRPAVAKGEAITAPAGRTRTDLRRDFTGVKVGTYVGIEDVGTSGAKRLWLFRCAFCRTEQRWDSTRITSMLKREVTPRCNCKALEHVAKDSPARVTVREVPPAPEPPKPARAPRTPPFRPQTNGIETLEDDELDGADDDLLAQSLALAEDDKPGKQGWHSAATRLREKRDPLDSEPPPPGAPADDEDAEEPDELDFEEATG